MNLNERDYEMVMPLITTVSTGGPHHDESYVAGWEMGELFAVLREIRPKEVERFVRTASLPQLGLILRKHGYLHMAARDVDGWSWVQVWRP